MKRLACLFGMIMALVIPALAEKPQEFFSAGNPIKYCGEKYYLAWSDHPQDIYYCQEYLPKGESLEKYNSMFTVSVIFWDREPLDAIKAKIAELEERKKTDKITNYVLAENDGEYMLEFIVSDSSNGKLNCVEVDIHYYRQLTIQGKKASVLCFYSARAYNDDILPFMESIPAHREKWYEAMVKLNITPKFKSGGTTATERNL